MMIFILGMFAIFHASDAYAVQHAHVQKDEPKSITLYINPEENSQRAKGRKRNSEDVLTNLYNNAPDYNEDLRSDGPELRSQLDRSDSERHPRAEKNSNTNLSKILKNVVSYVNTGIASTGADLLKEVVRRKFIETTRSGETRIDLVKIINAGFDFLSKLNPQYRTSGKRFSGKAAQPIEFRSNDDKSLLYEINTHKLIEKANEVLSSQVTRGYVDNIARKAAAVYRAVTKE